MIKFKHFTRLETRAKEFNISTSILKILKLNKIQNQSE